MQAWCDGTKWLEVRKLHMLPAKFAPGCVITLDALGNCVVDKVFQVSYYFETDGHPRASNTHAMKDYKSKLMDPRTSHGSAV